MTAQLSQRTLGLLRRVLEGMHPEDLATQEELSRFWKDALFDFGFAQAVIDVASSYEFEWGDIIPDLLVGRFGRQNSYISNALPPSLCEQTLKRLLAFALFYSRDSRLGDELRQALADDGFDLKADQPRSQFIEREQSRKRIERSEQTRKEAMAPASKSPILVLISHSSKDEGLASALIELLRAGLGLLATQIRCSSVDGYRLRAGVDTDAQLRKEIVNAGVLVGLLTPNSLSSTYVLFELGARWGIQRPMIPLLAGVTPEEMRGPHRVLNALSCSSESQLIQFIEDTGRVLEIDPQSSSSYLDKVRNVKKLADAVEEGTNPVQTLGEHTPTNATQQAVSATPQETKSTIDVNPPLPDAAGLINTGPGPNKRLIKRIMRGKEKLMAWEIVRAGLPNVFFVEFTVRNLEPGSCVTADCKAANAQWHEWYKLWSQQPGGFGGASGDGLDGKLPW